MERPILVCALRRVRKLQSSAAVLTTFQAPTRDDNQARALIAVAEWCRVWDTKLERTVIPTACLLVIIAIALMTGAAGAAAAFVFGVLLTLTTANGLSHRRTRKR
jgi:hypothetical protein